MKPNRGNKSAKVWNIIDKMMSVLRWINAVIKVFVILWSTATIFLTCGHCIHTWQSVNRYYRHYALPEFRALAEDIDESGEMTAYSKTKVWIDERNLLLNRIVVSEELEYKQLAFLHFENALRSVNRPTTLAKSDIVNDLKLITDILDNNERLINSMIFSEICNVAIEVASKVVLIYGLLVSSRKVLLVSIGWSIIKLTVLLLVVSEEPRAEIQLETRKIFTSKEYSFRLMKEAQMLYAQRGNEVAGLLRYFIDILVSLGMVDNGSTCMFLKRFAPTMGCGGNFPMNCFALIQCTWLLLYTLFFANSHCKTTEYAICDQLENTEDDSETRRSGSQKMADLFLYGKPADLKDYIRKYKFKMDVNDVLDEDGTLCTALHLVIKGGNPDMVKILLTEVGAKLDFVRKNVKGQTALDLAIQMGRPELVRVMLRCKRLPKVTDKDLINALRTRNMDIMDCIYSELKTSLSDTKADLAFRACLAYNPVTDDGGYARAKSLLVRILESKKSPAMSGTGSFSKDDFVCSRCFKLMAPPLKIFSCSDEHYTCSKCLEIKAVTNCVACLEDFTKEEPKRRATAERLLENLLRKKNV